MTKEYVEHRDAVLAMLRAEFPRLREPEELYQEAWAELLEKRARGGPDVIHVRALLRKIAWRRATDEWRKHKPDYFDPNEGPLAAAADSRLTPDVETEIELDAALLRIIAETLDEREAAVVKLRFDLGWSSKEIQRELGVSAGRLEKIVTSAYKNVLAQLELEPDGESAWSKKQRSLLLACEVGIASKAQHRRVQKLLESSPHCRAMLRQMRAALDDVAVLLPMPALETLHERTGHRIEVVGGWLENLRASARATANEVASRLPGGAGASEAAVAGSSAAGMGVAAKAVVACLAAGGTVAVCTTALFSGESIKDELPQTTPTAASRAVLEPPRTTVTVVRTPPPAPKPKAKPARRRASTTTSKPKQAPVSSPAYVAPASPAPQGSTEFGPGAIGSTAAPTASAAAPADGGGEFTP